MTARTWRAPIDHAAIVDASIDADGRVYLVVSDDFVARPFVAQPGDERFRAADIVLTADTEARLPAHLTTGGRLTQADERSLLGPYEMIREGRELRLVDPATGALRRALRIPGRTAGDVVASVGATPFTLVADAVQIALVPVGFALMAVVIVPYMLVTGRPPPLN